MVDKRGVEPRKAACKAAMIPISSLARSVLQSHYNMSKLRSHFAGIEGERLVPRFVLPERIELSSFAYQATALATVLREADIVGVERIALPAACSQNKPSAADLHPVEICSGTRTRTWNSRLQRPLICQLIYARVLFRASDSNADRQLQKLSS